MTSYCARLGGRTPKEHNKKEGGRRQPVRITGFWGLANFVPTGPGKWLYTWQGVDCPTFEVIEAGGEIAVNLIGGEIKATFINIPHIDVKDFLDDLILDLIRLRADADTPVVSGQLSGPEVAF